MKSRMSTGDRVFVICNTIFMLFVIFIMLYPFLNTLAVSLNEANDSLRGGIYLWPRIFTLNNYKRIFENELLLIAARNSVARTLIATAAGLFFSATAGYVLSRQEFVFNKIVTIYFLLTMYVSAGLIPTYFLYRQFGLINSFNVYWVPTLLSAWNIIIIRTYMQGLPDSLVEAARIDGAGEFRTYIQIILPICKPVLATVALWIAVGSWNSWFDTFIYTFGKDQERLTTLQYEMMKILSTAISQMSNRDPNAAAVAAQAGGGVSNTITPVAIRATITIVASVPILCVYPFLQKYFVKGVHMGSVKG